MALFSLTLIIDNHVDRIGRAVSGVDTVPEGA
jgi:hypothetical protein